MARRSPPWKVILDYGGAAIGLMLLAIPMAVVAVAVAANLGRPVLFRQTRPGRSEQPFKIMKFRSMRDAIDGDGKPLPDVERLTPFGRFLRNSSLDELPELINVLRGEMSLVGPRPLAMQYLPYYTDEERKRFALKPGITGWAQINGRSQVSWDEKLALDIWYHDHQSLWLDLRILVATVAKVVRRDGVIETDPLSIVDFDVERRARLAAAEGADGA